MSRVLYIMATGWGYEGISKRGTAPDGASRKSVPQVMSGSVTSFRSSSATASSGNGALVDKLRLLPALSWGRNAAPKLTHTAKTHP